MAIRKTSKLLPIVFQTDTNEKFLSATLDQLVTEPNLRTINGYIGRRFAPTYKGSDSYVREITVDRQNFQLEPSLVIKDKENNITFFTTYLDFLNKLKYYGASITNHSRLFDQEYYSYDPKISFDKIVNFSQYYWLPNGPDTVNVFAGQIESTNTFVVSRNASTGTYSFNSNGVDKNSIILARGGTYKFVVDQPGIPFWIQSELGLDGRVNAMPTLSSRDMLGVTNNGIDVGTITYQVPLATAQDYYLNMPRVYSADFTVSLAYSSLQGQLVSQVNKNPGVWDGLALTQLNGKSFVFINQDQLTNTKATTKFVNAGIPTDIIFNNIAGTSVSAAGVYSRVKQKSTSGLGSGALFNITKTGNGSIYNYAVTIQVASSGVNYSSGDTITISGASLGGVDLLNDLVFTVTQPDPFWTTQGPFVDVPWDETPWAFNPPDWDHAQFGIGATVPVSQRISVWTLYLVPSTNVLTLSKPVTVKAGDKITQYSSGASATVTQAATNSVSVNVTYDNGIIFTNVLGVPTSTADTRCITINGVTQLIYPVNSPNNDYIIRLDNRDADGKHRIINQNEKVNIRSGAVNANKDFYRSTSDILKPVPLITAVQPVTYYQDGASSSIYGSFKLVNISDFIIDVEQDILGKEYYTSPNGVAFTSGLKIKFDDTVIPDQYKNNTYYVEQVGAGIILVDVRLLITPEKYNSENKLNYPLQRIVLSLSATAPIAAGDIILVDGISVITNQEVKVGDAYIITLSDVSTVLVGGPVTAQGIPDGTTVTDIHYNTVFPEYVTINRASQDLNAWSRNNRWFHRQVITAAASYNNKPAVFDQSLRALRPIIQFETNIQLFNYGINGKPAINILDTTTTDAFTELNGKNISFAFGVTVTDGMRIVFAADYDPLVRDKIWVINLIQPYQDENGVPYGLPQINLVKADDGDVVQYDTVVVAKGRYAGSQWWYDGNAWHAAQNKTAVYQPPLYDMIDNNGVSLSAKSRSTFSGTNIFGYAVGNGTNDKVLGFPLSYRSIGTQGDIEFTNFIDTDTYSYELNGVVYNNVPISTAFLQKNKDSGPEFINVWQTAVEYSKQFQILSFVYNTLNYPFQLDLVPDQESLLPYISVYLNNNYLKNTDWYLDGTLLNLNVPFVPGDKIDVRVYSKQVSKQGYYQIPNNLDYNGLNVDLGNVTLGQFRNHVSTCGQNSKTIVGDLFGVSNLRDIEIKAQGGTILQHSAPITYAMMFMVEEQANFISALKLAQQEYTKFKNKFLELSVTLTGVDPTDPISTVDLILNNINSIKNKTFPWYYSDMVPYGTLFNQITYTVFDPLTRYYEITQIFNGTQLSNQAVLVYLNGQQLVKEYNYSFATDRPAIILTDNTPLFVDDIIVIKEYSNTDGNYIPETPSKLGLWPKFIPVIFTDDTYRTATDVIKGHDGSLTPVFGDYRDALLIELERRIYNNIKVFDTGTYPDIYASIPGKFRKTDYLNSDVARVLSSSFLLWIGNNKLDFSSNNVFDPNDPFTWNYGGMPDRIDGEALPGSWRACYQYFFDTVRPHITPWEMLGFAEQPYWWQQYYGPAPYTGGNKLLWDDLEAGTIRAGFRAIDNGDGTFTPTYDPHFQRPGLKNIIPVDENGYLLSPGSILTQIFNSKTASASYDIGQQGPVEFAWRTSSDFPFAAMQALAVLKPARFFGTLMDISRYNIYNAQGQFLTVDTNQHIRQKDIVVNGDTTSMPGTVLRAAGYINWIADYLINQGINPVTKLMDMINGHTLNLAYKVGGFTDKKYIKVLAEQSSPSSTNNSIVIPNENYSVYLYKTPPVQKITYSAVIVEKTSAGYSVRGYNLTDPYFTIIPSIVNSSAISVKVLNSTAVIYNDYRAVKLTVPYGYEFNTQQQLADFLISYQRYLVGQGFQFTDSDSDLSEIKDWKLSVKEFLFWAQQGWKKGSILVLSPASSSINVITNGAIVDEVTSTQYGSKVLDQNFNLVRNTDFKILRSPTAFNLRLTNLNTIAYVELNLVQYEHALVFDNTTLFNDVIYKPELGNRQFRLKLIGQKTANWDGSLSAPGFIYNSGNVNDWIVGKDYLQGDIVQYKNQYYTALQDIIAANEFQFQYWKYLDKSQIQTGLLSNFSSISHKGAEYYDSYSSFNDADQVAYGHGLIGYKSRSYLEDLGLTETTQIEFYKGYIKQKGSANAVNELITASFNNSKSAISYFEEYAVRVGEYGALDSNPYLEISLDEKAFGVNPAVAEFVDYNNRTLGNGITIFNNAQLHKSTSQFNGNIALLRDSHSDYNNDIPTAGYVNIDDVDATIFDLANYQQLDMDLSVIGSGYTIWCAKDFTQNWNVYRVTETENHITKVTNNLDGYITFTSEQFHNLTAGKICMIRNFDPAFDGFYQVYKVVDLTNIMVAYAGNTSNLTVETGRGMLFRLDSVRFKYIEDQRFYMPPHGYKVGEKIWVDIDAATTFVQGQPVETPANTWKVYEKTAPWHIAYSLAKRPEEYVTNDGFGTSVRISDGDDGTFAFVGSPNSNSVDITLNNNISLNSGNYITQPSSGANLLILNDVNTSKNIIGKYLATAALDLIGNITINGNNSIYIPTKVTARSGVVNVFAKTYDNKFVEQNLLVPTANNTVSFGASLELGAGTPFVGAPDSNNGMGYVYVYNKQTAITSFIRAQVLTSNVAGDKFGTSVASDQNSRWLYVGAPGHDSVYVYGLRSDIKYAKQTVAAIPTTSNIALTFIPQVNDANSLLVTTNSKTYIPGIDYNLDYANATVKFTAVVGSYVDITVTQKPYYAFVTKLTGPTGSNFGFALSSSYDGAQLGIGAPNDTVNNNGNLLINAGSVYVYDRVIEAFNSTGNTDYITKGAISIIHRVTIDEIEVTDYTVVGTNTIRFTEAPPLGKLIYIETNYFNILETLVGVNNLEGDVQSVQAGAFFGTSLTICSNNCAIYVGAPNYRNGNTYNTGAVFKFHNRGRLYGTNRGYAVNPTFTVGDYIRLDNFEVYATTSVANITINNIGNNYSSGTTVVVSNPDTTYGTAPAASLSLYANGAIQSVSITNLTTGYYNTPTVTLVKPANVITTMSSISGTNLTVGTTYAVYSGMYVNNASFGSNVYVTNVYSDTLVGLSFKNTSPLSGNVTFFDKGNAGNLTASLTTNTITLDGFIGDINNSKLLGCTATKQYVAANQAVLVINSDKTVFKNILRILSGSPSGSTGIYANANMKIFAFMQIIINPYNAPGEYFGTKVKLASNAYMLLISSDRGTTRDYTVFDHRSTTFDNTTTEYFDTINGSGSAYVYELYDDPRNVVEHPGRYHFAQQLDTGDLNRGDRFGAAIDIVGQYIAVTAPADSTQKTNAGSVYVFTNPKLTRGWNLIRYEQPKVDVDSVNRIFLYNNLTNTIRTNLEFIDPAKGKILGVADQEISYKSAYDPAAYNRGTTNVNTSYYWNENQVGQVWWNLDSIRFIDYEQGDLAYRSVNWGRLFPGSVVEVCEWVESTVLPSGYVAAGYDGVPKHADNSAYVEISYVDSVTNVISSKYYFWVTGKTSITKTNSNRSLPIASIQTLIENPKGQGIAYAAIIKNNAISTYNINQYLSANSTILHLDYELVKNTNIIHSEYELIQKGNPDSKIPDKVINKLVDSLSGINQAGEVVPDPKLSLADRYGIGIRPRQSMFVDRVKAMHNLVQFVNGVLIQYPITKEYDISELNSQEPIPPSKTQAGDLGVYDISIPVQTDLQFVDTADLKVGYKVLVVSDTTQNGLWVIYELAEDGTWKIYRVQSYVTSKYWQYTDWYATGYSAVDKPTYNVGTLIDALKLPYAVGNIIKINNTGTGLWQLVKVNSSGAFDTIGIQNGTIQLDYSVSDYASYNVGFGNQAYQDNRFDENPNIEIRSIIDALRTQIFVGNLAVEFNNLFFVMVNYVFSEQNYVDWIFKTSFISVKHQLRALDQFPSYIQDNQTYYQDYINEVKPYSTKIREYLIDYTANDRYLGFATDFDLPPYYDSSTGIFRSPSGDGYNVDVGTDEALWQKQDYISWYNHRNSIVSRIIVEDGGSGYTTVPNVSIIGGGSAAYGVNATATAILNFDTGTITSIVVNYSGSGYSQSPDVVINGNSTTPARAYAVLTNPWIRNLGVTMKFDRIGYTSVVKDWIPGNSYIAGDIVRYNGEGYTVNSNLTANLTFLASQYTKLTAADFDNANDRIMAYYTPNNKMPARDLKQIIFGVEYPGVIITGLPFTAQPGFDATSDRPYSTPHGIQLLSIEERDAYYSSLFTSLDTVVSNLWYNQDLGIMYQYKGGYPYQPNAWVAVPGASNLGIDFDGDQFDNVQYDSDGNPVIDDNVLDTVISSKYTDAALGTRPEDINIDGGRYVDTYSSHAPEEFVPGICFDAISMQVYTKVGDGSGGEAIIGYRMFNNMLNNTSYFRIADSGSTQLSQDLNLTDTEIHVFDANKLAEPNPVASIPGIIFVNGERITYYTRDLVNNVLGQIRRGTEGTCISVTHKQYDIVVDASLDQVVPGVKSGTTNRLTDTTYKVTDTPAYYVKLSSNISVNVGDTITQTTSGATVTVIGIDNPDTGYVLINYFYPNQFQFTNYIVQLSGPINTVPGDIITQPSSGANLTVIYEVDNNANVTFRYNTVTGLDIGVGNVSLNGVDTGIYPQLVVLNSNGYSNLAINGSYTHSVYPVAVKLTGSTDSAGNITIAANTTLATTETWYNLGANVATDGTGFNGSTSVPVTYLKQQVAMYNVGLKTEDWQELVLPAVNILITEDNVVIIEE